MSTPQPVGIDGLKKIIKFGVDAGNVLGAALQGGSFSLMEIPEIFSLLSESKDALGNMSDLKAELLALTPDDRNGLESYVMTNLKMPQAETEQTIEKSVQTVCMLHAIYLLWAK